MFTADPVTSNRKVTYVEATFGLGEALASGLVNADGYRVRDGGVVARTSPPSRCGPGLARWRDAGRGDRPGRRERPALTDTQVLRLAQLGRRIEAHFGHPQDIEWCLVDDDFLIVQSRPITTLFPIPAPDDQDNHVYVSVGHAQMMTDAMKPLGLSLWQLTTPRPMYVAGGRLFVDVASGLASPTSRAGLLEVLGRGDPLVGDALRTILERDDFIPTLEDDGSAAAPGGAPAPRGRLGRRHGAHRTQRGLHRGVAERHPREVRPGVARLHPGGHPRAEAYPFRSLSHQVFMSAMEASRWLNEQLETWLGERNAADTLTQSVPHNVTSEMGLALLDVADVIRPFPEVVTYLQNAEDDGFLDELPGRVGGQQARDAIVAYLDKYGMRCVGEIDITRPRWSERPATLVPVILGNIENFEAGAGARRFEQGRREAWAKEQELLERLRALPDGEQKAEETKRMIDRVRTFIGYREYPKYGMVSRYFVYKQALLEEAGRLVQARVLGEREDVFYLSFQELHDVARTNQADDDLVSERKKAFRSYQALTPPRVLTSDGEVVAGAYRRQGVPAGALVGLSVSAGTVEGRARVVLDMAEADLEAGDILVTAYTDPSWTPVFVGIAGLVTEVGGLMTHGAVIAREYGLPAVVGVEHATRLIRDGQRIRVHGTEGYVEILP